MIKNYENIAFLNFNRSQWAKFGNGLTQNLTQKDLKNLSSFNENLDFTEVEQIYLPLTRLINYYIAENIKRQSVLNKFLNIHNKKTPYIISIAGSVAVGKSTTARILQTLLSDKKHKVSLVTTDGFLLPLTELKQANLLTKKGFPESYDLKALIEFLTNVRAGLPNLKVPLYSHLIYDLLPDTFYEVNCPDILILEGLNVLQNHNNGAKKIFVSDFVDFSIFVDAKTSLLENWYLERFEKLRLSAFQDPKSYFHHYTELTPSQAKEKAQTIWNEINLPNLKQNIAPCKYRANLILQKGENHKVEKIKLRS